MLFIPFRIAVRTAVLLIPLILPLLIWDEQPGPHAVAGQNTVSSSLQTHNDKYQADVLPLLKKYCLTCHSTALKKGSLDLERFTITADIHKDLKPWQNMIEQIETGEMPPKKKPQPTVEEKKQLLAWVREYLDYEARTRAGDPGHVPLRRLSNAATGNFMPHPLEA